MKPTEETTQYAIRSYVQPARDRGDDTVNIRVGKLQKELGWTGRTPAVFSTLKSQLFQREAGVELLEKRGGPASGGPSTTVEFVYRVLNISSGTGTPPSGSHNGGGLMSLYGAGKEVFEQLGGGEAYLNRERDELQFPAEGYPVFGERK